MSCVVVGRCALLCRIGFGSAISSSSNRLFHRRPGCYSSSSWLRLRVVRHQSTAQLDYPPLQITPKTSSMMSTSSDQTERREEIVPWLFLSTWSSSEKKYTRYMYRMIDSAQEKIMTINPSKIHLRIPTEMINYFEIIGSSEGYLLTVGIHQEIHAMNPLTGSYLLLPSTASLPNMIGILRNSISGNKITHYVIQHDDDRDEPRIEQYLYQGKGKGKGKGSNINSFLFQRIDPTSTMDIFNMWSKNYYGKAILSPSLDAAVVIHGLYPEGQLAFVRVGLQGTPPSSWTPLHKSSESSGTSFIDIIFHQGRLHALDRLSPHLRFRQPVVSTFIPITCRQPSEG